MVRLTVDFRASEREAAPLVQALRSLVRSVRPQPGCLECSVVSALESDAGVRYVERWSNEEAMSRRVRSDDFTRLLAVMERAPDAPELSFEFVDRVRGLDYVAAVRGLATSADSRER